MRLYTSISPSSGVGLRAKDIALVVGQPGGVVDASPAQGFLDVLPIAGFIAHGPQQHAGVIGVGDDPAWHPVQHRFLVVRVPHEQGHAALFSVQGPRAVGFQVRFANDIEAIFVRQLIEARRVGVVAGADGVDVVLLHQAHIPQNVLPGHGVTRLRIAVVAVDAVHEYPLTIEQHQTVANLNGAQSRRWAALPGGTQA